METRQIKKQLTRIGQTFAAAAEMCERHAATGRINSYLAVIQQDSGRLQSMLDFTSLDARFGLCLRHMKATADLLMQSCEELDHKDTRMALQQLTGEVAALEKYLQ